MKQQNENGRLRLKDALEQSDRTFLEKYSLAEEEMTTPSYEEMKHYIKKSKKKRFQTVCFQISRCAVLLLVFLGGFLLSAMIGDIFAEPQDFMDFRTEVDEDGYLHVFFDREAREGAPETLEVKYAPSYIPEGYVSEIDWNSSTQTRIRYHGPDGNKITFEQWCKSMSWGVKTSAASFEIRRVEGVRVGIYTYYHKTQYVAYWSDDDYGFYLLIEAPLSMEEIEKIILSLEPTEMFN